jgi:hypothetical protein
MKKFIDHDLHFWLRSRKSLLKSVKPVGVGVVNKYREFCLVVNQGKKEKENHYSPVSNQTSIKTAPSLLLLSHSGSTASR